MKINTYSTLLNDDGHCTLVKEKSFNYPKEDNFNSARKIVTFMNDIFFMNKLDTEHVYMLCMNSKCCPTAIFCISKGTVNMSLASPREVLIKALLANSVNIILIHNHPSGYVEPSKEDYSLTKKFKDAFKLLDIHFIDHIIIAGNNFFSFAEEKII